jgi:lysophospholipase L1-like esterase
MALIHGARQHRASARHQPFGGRTVRSRLTLLRSIAATSALGVVLGLASAADAATPDAGPPPSSMASLGDSITRGFDACGFFVDCTSRSWSTGDYGSVNSHYLRIRAVNPAINGRNSNDARTGAVAADLYGQAGTAVSQGVQYVTVLMGANDACKDTESQMTPVTTFRSQVDAGLDRIRAGLRTARILVVSIPDLKRLWYVAKNDWRARTAWAVGGICQTMLRNPTSTAQADEDRRNRVQQRVRDFNAALRDSCARLIYCRYDGGAVFNYPFTFSMLSGWDYFHPNTAGQAELARVTYAVGYGW